MLCLLLPFSTQFYQSLLPMPSRLAPHRAGVCPETAINQRETAINHGGSRCSYRHLPTPCPCLAFTLANAAVTLVRTGGCEAGPASPLGWGRRSPEGWRFFALPWSRREHCPVAVRLFPPKGISAPQPHKAFSCPTAAPWALGWLQKLWAGPSGC